jgi:hypothetical protein
MHPSLNVVDRTRMNPDGTYDMILMLTNYHSPFNKVFLADEMMLATLMIPTSEFALRLATPNGIPGGYNSTATDDLDWRHGNNGHVRAENVSLFLKRVWLESTELEGYLDHLPVMRIMGSVKPAGPRAAEFERMIDAGEPIHLSVACQVEYTCGMVYDVAEFWTWDLTSSDRLAIAPDTL